MAMLMLGVVLINCMVLSMQQEAMNPNTGISPYPYPYSALGKYPYSAISRNGATSTYPYKAISQYPIAAISPYPKRAIVQNPNTAKNEILQQQNSQSNSKERIEYLIDNSVDPCEDFFQYACSNKNRGKEFPYGRKEVTQNLTKLIEEVSGDFSFLRDFYDSCVSITSQFSTEDVVAYCIHDNKCPKEELEKFNIVYQQFREDILSFAKHTSPPVLTDDWESRSENFTWQKLSEDILRDDYYLGAFQYVKERRLSRPATENFFSSVFFAPMIDNSVKLSLALVSHISKSFSQN